MTATTAPRRDRTAAHARQVPEDTLAGLATMVRFRVHRDRVRLAAWWLVLVGMFAYVCAYYRDLLGTPEALRDFAMISDTPGVRALTGLAAAPATPGGAVWTKIWMTSALALAFGALFLVTRAGRADEEAGRTELLRSRVLGVHAGSVAGWGVTGALVVAVGLGVAAASILGGLDPEGAGVAGSLVLGASVSGVGLLGVGVGALAGQVATTSRAANALGSAVLGGCYLLRMAGDLGDGTLTWASPIGWAQEMRPWGGDRWWPLALLLALAATLLVVSVRVEARRDHGRGVLAERRGPAGAPARWARPLWLALRLQRGPLLGWTATVLLAAAMFGSVAEAMTDLFADSGGAVADVARGTGVDALLALLVAMLAVVVTVFAIQSAVTLRSEEAAGFAEIQLAGALSRIGWTLQHLLIPVLGAGVLLAAAGGVLGLEHGGPLGDPEQAGRFALAALAYWPAVMVYVGLAVALFGWAPRLSVPVTWGILVASFFAMILGDALPAWVLDALPFSATPYQPYEPLTWTPLVLMAAVAGAGVAAGTLRFARRDVQTG